MHKAKALTVTGTSNFPSTNAALRYYQTYVDADFRGSDIVKKIKEKSIEIGRPEAKEGFTIMLHPEEERYYLIG